MAEVTVDLLSGPKICLAIVSGACYLLTTLATTCQQREGLSATSQMRSQWMPEVIDQNSTHQ